MSERSVDGRAAKRTDDQRYMKEVEALREAAHFLASAASELESLRLELAVLTVTGERRSGASPGDSRPQKVHRREL